MTRDEIRAALDGRLALICTLSGEAAGESACGQLAVACVVRNRVLHPGWWGTSFKTVCLHPWQFSCWWENSPNTERVYALADSLLTGTPPPAQLAAIAEGVISGRLEDITHGATHYLTVKLLATAPPEWTKTGTRLDTVGHHVFFKAT